MSDVPPASLLPGPRLGLLFLTRGDVNHTGIWEEFAADAGERIMVFSHPKFPDAVRSGFLKGKCLETIHETQWGSISLVRAMLSLLREAMRDELLTHFVFLSESCVPIKSWAAIEAGLASDPRTMAEMSSFSGMKSFHAERHRAATGIPRECWRLHSQWLLMDRATASCVLEEDLTERFSRVFAPDEHYFGTVLALKNHPESSIRSQNVTWVDWNRGYPASFTSVDDQILRELIGFPGYFARKFTVGSDIARGNLHRFS